MTLHHHALSANDFTLHAAVQGDGPLVVLCHGFPGLWYSWRHQLPALAAAGYRAVALDMRGYGGSDVPTRVDDYRMEHILADLQAVLAHFGERRAVFVGHDFGAAVVWTMAQRHPQQVRAVAALSVPFDFDLYGRGGAGSGGNSRGDFASSLRPTRAFALAAEQSFLHAHYFQAIGPADRELDAQPRAFLRRLFWTLGGCGDYLHYRQFPSAGHGYLDVLPDDAPPLPWPWLSEADLDYYVQAFSRTGFSGGLNWYRVADANWEAGAAWADVDIAVPALFMAGDKDPVLAMINPEAIAIMRRRVPGLRGVQLLAGAGHWVQQEAAAVVNEGLLHFLDGLEE